MKSKFYIFFIFFGIVTTSVQSQTPKSVEILGNTYSLSYDSAEEIFEMCKGNKTSSSCTKTTIAKDKEIVFIKALNSSLNTEIQSYTFKILEQEKTLADFKTIDYTKVTIYIDSMVFANKNNEVPLKFKDTPDKFPEFKIKNIGNNNYELSQKDILSTPIKMSFSDTITVHNSSFKASVMTKLGSILDSKKHDIAKLYVSIIEKIFDDLLQELYTESISKNESYSFLTTQKLTDLSTDTSSYNFLVLINDQLHLKVYKNTEKKEDADKYGEFKKGFSENGFVDGMITQHNTFEDSELNREVLGKVYHMIKTKKEEKTIVDAKKQFKEDLLSTIKKIENAKTTYGGQMVLNKKVPLYQKKDIGEPVYKWLKFKTERKKGLVKSEKHQLIVDSIDVRFFNNRADNITIVGRLDKDKKTRILTNSQYSLPLREFNSRDRKNSFTTEGNETYYYYYDDILNYLPYKKTSSAIKNSEIKIIANDSTKVVERKIGDYFTGIFFSDFLGLNSNNSNSLIIAEGRIRIPMNLRNMKKWTLIDNLTAYASVNLFSGFENSTRKIILEDTEDPDDTSEANAARFTSDNLNLLKNNNIDAGINVTPISFEWKGASTFIHLRYGLRLLRTGIEYNLKSRDSLTDVMGNVTVTENILEQKEFQVFSVGQEVEINFEIRPQSLVGADVSIGLNWFGATGTNKNDVEFSTTNNAPNLKIMANIYSLVSSEDNNSGVYFRLGGHYNLGNYKLFPQIMVGYATNLSSFVNKVKKE